MAKFVSNRCHTPFSPLDILSFGLSPGFGQNQPHEVMKLQMQKHLPRRRPRANHPHNLLARPPHRRRRRSVIFAPGLVEDPCLPLRPNSNSATVARSPAPHPLQLGTPRTSRPPPVGDTSRLGDMPFNFAQQFRSKRQSTQNIGGSFTRCWKNLVSFPLTQPSGNNHEVIFFGA
jgi:hypothetical protein